MVLRLGSCKTSMQPQHKPSDLVGGGGRGCIRHPVQTGSLLWSLASAELSPGARMGGVVEVSEK